MAEKTFNYTPEYAHAADMNFEKVMRCVEAKKQPARPVEYDENDKVLRGELLKGNMLPIGCSYCGAKFTCWAEPKQVVKFDENAAPAYKTTPTSYLTLEFKKDRWGGAKPTYRVV